MPRIPRFIQLPRARRRIRADIDEEMRFDLDMRAADLIKEGLDPREARERAAREFGDMEATRHFCEEIDMQLEADARHRTILEDLRADMAIALRGIRRAPVFAAVVLLTLALGIGANTAIFSVVHRVLVVPLPFRAPDQLYRLYTSPSSTGDHDKLSAVELTELAAQSHALAGLTWFGNYAGTTFTDDRTAEAWQAVSVDGNFFSVLGIQPELGRILNAADFQPGAPPAVMISHQVWQRSLGGDRAIAGRVIQLSGRPTTVVGVLPEHFVGPTFNADVLRPLNISDYTRNPRSARSRVWRSVARLKPDVSMEEWQAELAVLAPRLQRAYPEIRNAGVFLPMPLHEAVVGGAGSILRFVMAGALVVLLAACVNIAGLFLSRAVARQRELGVRTSLGASRGRLVRQLIAETLLYGVLGGVLGMGLAIVLKAVLLRQIGPLLPKVGEVNIDLAVLAFAFVLSIVSGLAFAVLPALSATRVDVRQALGDGGTRAASRGSSASRASRVLVCAQLACAVVLAVAAGLLTRTFQSITATDLGYETTDHQASFYISTGGRSPGSSLAAFTAAFVDRIRSVPGVTAVGYTVTAPWGGVWRGIRFRPVGMSAGEAEALPGVALATASADFFAATGMTIKKGRSFNADDRLGSPPVIVISETMARRFWPNSNPIGTFVRLDFSGSPSDTSAAREIVGIVGDVRADATSEPTPTLYVSEEQMRYFGNRFVVRTTGDAASILGVVRAAIRDLDPRVALLLPQTLDEVRSDQVRRQHVAMILMAMFAGLAVLLAGLGTYGIMAYGVACRTKEFGIRTALGASSRSILGLVIRDGVAMTVAGIATGTLVALAASRVATSLLYGVKATDPTSYAWAVGLLLATALVACLLPARKATLVEPVETLRSD